MRPPRPAALIALLALLVALGGTATAARSLITGADVKNNSLTGAEFRNLTGADVKNNSLTGVDVKNLTGADIRDRGVQQRDLAPDAVALVGGRGRARGPGSTRPGRA